MNVLVTGGAGFVGAALVARLIAEGHRVTVVDDGSAGSLERVPEAARVYPFDIRAAQLGQVFSASRPEAVAHLAALTGVVESVREPERCAEVNVAGSAAVLRASAAVGVRRFVFASTGGALYGDGAPRPTAETCQPRPLSPYGASKAAAEAFVETMAVAAGMSHVSLRLGNVYGPRRGGGQAPGVVGRFAHALTGGERAVIYGDGLTERDYVHLDDVVEAHVRALASDAAGAINIASGTASTVREIYAEAARAAGRDETPEFAPGRPGELRYSRLDVERAARVLGWRARTPLARGVADTVRASRSAPDAECGGTRRTHMRGASANAGSGP